MSFRQRPLLSLFLLGALFAAGLTLSACGRKGPLDPPPSELAPTSSQPTGMKSATPGDGPPPAPPSRSMPMDFLLN